MFLPDMAWHAIELLRIFLQAMHGTSGNYHPLHSPGVDPRLFVELNSVTRIPHMGFLLVLFGFLHLVLV